MIVTGVQKNYRLDHWNLSYVAWLQVNNRFVLCFTRTHDWYAL